MQRVKVVAVTLLVLAVACSTTQRDAKLQVRTEYEAGAAFSQWKTFRIASVPSTHDDADSYPRLEKSMREALVAELEARGYQPADNGSTDFRVAFDLVFRGTTSRDGPDRTHDVDTGPAASTGRKPTATLTVQMLDPATSKVLWQGELGGVEIDAVNPEAALRKAAWRVLMEFPPLNG